MRMSRAQVMGGKHPARDRETSMTAQPNTPADRVINPLKSGADSVLEKGAERLAEARERVGDVLTRTRDRAVEMQEQFEDYVQERPIKSVLVAAGVGAGIG